MSESTLDFIRQNASLFDRVGSVVATYRSRDGRRFGPYYRLIYRQNQRQRSLYLGPSEQLAGQVRELLAELQQRRNHLRLCRRAERLRMATLLQIKREFQQVARLYGLRTNGWSVRGLRALGWPRSDKITPLKRLPYPYCSEALLPSATPAPSPSPPTIFTPTPHAPAQGGSLLPSATPTPSPAVPHPENTRQSSSMSRPVGCDIVQTASALPNSPPRPTPHALRDIVQTASALPNSPTRRTPDALRDIVQTASAPPTSRSRPSPPVPHAAACPGAGGTAQQKRPHYP